MTSPPPAKRFNWNDLGVRVLSALVLIPAALLAVWDGGWPFLLLVGAGAVLLGREWGLMSAPQAPVRVGIAVALGVLASVVAAWLGHISAAFVLLVFGAVAAGVYARAMRLAGIDAAYGVLYLGWPCVVLVWLRGSDGGLAWTFLVFVVAWSSDIAAYVIGNVFKGPKLWPRFSPNKTWSGFVGGLAAGLIAAVAAGVGFGPDLTWPVAAAVGLIGALATMGGDLWESALKRRFGVKDAGQLIPGHGGLLDRVDGLMFAVVAVAAARLVITWSGL